ncbi:MAG: hypothetical protein GX898_11820 [Corynebacterium sp.]|nr:hypothetical protein [Corynebacterium sp.]NMA72972.1 hypothetical protein [Bacteroidales bacterium]
MGKSKSYKPNQTRCIVYASGISAESSANRIEQYAYEHDMAVIDTVIGNGSGIGELEYYLNNDSIEAILLRSVNDISTDKKEVQRVIELALKHGISVNCEEMGFEPVTVNFEDDV